MGHKGHIVPNILFIKKINMINMRINKVRSLQRSRVDTNKKGGRVTMILILMTETVEKVWKI